MVETGLTGVGSYPNLLGVGIPFYASNVSGNVASSGGGGGSANGNVNTYNLTSSIIGNKFDASQVTQYNANTLTSNVLSNSNANNNKNPSPSFQPRTPSNITTTSNNPQ